jgi:hypothetical protein
LGERFAVGLDGSGWRHRRGRGGGVRHEVHMEIGCGVSPALGPLSPER